MNNDNASALQLLIIIHYSLFLNHFHSPEAGLEVRVAEAFGGSDAAIGVEDGDIRVGNAVEMGGLDDGVVAHVVQDDGVIHLERVVK